MPERMHAALQVLPSLSVEMAMSSFKNVFSFLSVDPVTLGTAAKLLAALACLVSIGLMACVSHALNLGTAYPLIVASMGASAVIVFFCRTAPWPNHGP